MRTVNPFKIINDLFVLCVYMRGRPSFLGGYRILLVDLASSSASDGDALTLDLLDPLLRALLRELRLVVLVHGAADKVVATDRPPESRSIQMP